MNAVQLRFYRRRGVLGVTPLKRREIPPMLANLKNRLYPIFLSFIPRQSRLLHIQKQPLFHNQERRLFLLSIEVIFLIISIAKHLNTVNHFDCSLDIPQMRDNVWGKSPNISVVNKFSVNVYRMVNYFIVNAGKHFQCQW